MSVKGREFREYVQRCLDELGIKRYAFGHTKGAHQEVRFKHAGSSIRFVFPGSPSDRRGHLNSRTTLRHLVRSAERLAVPAAPEARSVLDAGRVLPRKSHDVGGGREGFRKLAPSVRCRWACYG